MTTNNADAISPISADPALAPGDTFTIFNVGPYVFTTPQVISPGVTWDLSNLENGGTVTVATVASQPPHLTNSISGKNLVMSWDASWLGSHLQVQTNTLAKGLGTNWVTIDGTDTVLGYTNTVSSATNAVFYRLIGQ